MRRPHLAGLLESSCGLAVSAVTPLVLDSSYAVLRAGGASVHKAQKVHRFLSAAFNRAVRYGRLGGNPCIPAT